MLLFYSAGVHFSPPAFIGSWSWSIGDNEYIYTLTEDTFKVILESRGVPTGGERGSLSSTSKELALTSNSQAASDGNGVLTWSSISDSYTVTYNWSVNGDILTLGSDFNDDGTITQNEIMNLNRVK